MLFRHALRPSSLTLLTVAGLNVGALIGGALVVERIFNLPGIGDALAERSSATSCIETAGPRRASSRSSTCSFNFFVDILYTVLDPRIRHARALA